MAYSSAPLDNNPVIASMSGDGERSSCKVGTTARTAPCAPISAGVLTSRSSGSSDGVTRLAQPRPHRFDHAGGPIPQAFHGIRSGISDRARHTGHALAETFAR